MEYDITKQKEELLLENRAQRLDNFAFIKWLNLSRLDAQSHERSTFFSQPPTKICIKF